MSWSDFTVRLRTNLPLSVFSKPFPAVYSCTSIQCLCVFFRLLRVCHRFILFLALEAPVARCSLFTHVAWFQLFPFRASVSCASYCKCRHWNGSRLERVSGLLSLLWLPESHTEQAKASGDGKHTLDMSFEMCQLRACCPKSMPQPERAS